VLDKIEDILEELRAGRMIVLVDDESRENEGDLVCAAEHVTPEAINFMARFGRGLICVPMTAERADALGLHPQTSENAALHGTAFTVSVDAATGVTTGISAADRARTIEILANDVKCGHGSTVGPLDADQRYYLMSRGLDRIHSDRKTCCSEI